MIMHILKSNAMERCLPAILSGMLLAACSVAEPPREQLSVSIEPLSFLVRQITGDDFEINVLVPPAASPETYAGPDEAGGQLGGIRRDRVARLRAQTGAVDP